MESYSLICCGTNVDLCGFTPRLKLVGEVHIVTKQAISGHACSHYPCQDRPGMDANPHLYRERTDMNNGETELWQLKKRPSLICQHLYSLEF